MQEALERLAYDAGGDQNNPLIRDKTLESIERARSAIAKAKTASFQQNATAHLPIVTVTVRGGLIEDMDATIPVHVVVEDWDVPDEDTGEMPTRDGAASTPSSGSGCTEAGGKVASISVPWPGLDSSRIVPPSDSTR